MLCPKTASPSSSASRHLPSQVETVLNHDDLLTQILVRLPPKSILKFKSVSTRWLSLITSPTFVPKQNPKAISGLCFGVTRQGPKPSYGFINLNSSPSRAPFTSLDFAHDPFGIRILESCNGLILFSSNNANTAEKSFYIYNPTTNQSTALPALFPRPPVISGASLSFDPSKSPHYKVICVLDIGPVTYSDEYHYKMVIYSSETLAWRPCGGPFPATGVDFTNGVFWNRSVHWPSLYYGSSSSLRFDVDEEQILELPMPMLITEQPVPIPVVPDPDDEEEDEDENYEMFLWLRYRYFGESRDHLHFVEIHESNPLEFNVYELEPDYSGWFVRYKVHLSSVVVAFPEMVRGSVAETGLPNYVFTMLGVVREEVEEDESYLVLQLPSHQAVRYKLEDGSCSKICDLDPDKCSVSFNLQCPSNVLTYYVYQFIESLASV